jgi:hypothetical protein
VADPDYATSFTWADRVAAQSLVGKTGRLFVPEGRHRV